MQLSPFLTVFGLRRLRTAIRLVRFGYNTFTGCVAKRVAPTPPFPLKREPTATAQRGTTVNARIDRDISLIMPPSFVCQLRTQTAQSDGTNRQARRSLFSPPCGSDSVFELAYTVYKNAVNSN